MIDRPSAAAESEIAIVPAWPAPPGVHARSTLRTGGVSRSGYASLNLGDHVGDDPAHVAENRRRLVERLALPAEPCWLEQVHGREVLDLDRVGGGADPRGRGGGFEPGAPRAIAAPGAPRDVADPGTPRDVADPGTPRGGADPADTAACGRSDVRALGPADAAVTSCPGVVCVVLTADCVPVLLADRGGRRIGAAHAGWRGLAQGVLPATVAALGVPPADLIAWLGPAIGPGAFEVGDEVRASFAGQGFAVNRAFRRNARGRWQADLYALATESLNRAGVEAVHGGDRCTFTEAEHFFSHRREAPCGRMASLIWID